MNKKALFDLIAGGDRILNAVKHGKFTDEALEALGLDRGFLAMGNDPNTRKMVVDSINTAREGYELELAYQIGEHLDPIGAFALTKGDATGALRLADLFRVFPNLTLRHPEFEAALATHGEIVLPQSYANSLEFELLNLVFDGQVRLALEELEEEPNATMPADMLTMGPVTQADVLYLGKALGAKIRVDKKRFELWGSHVHILDDGGYVVDKRMEVRSTLVITRSGAQMLDGHQMMYLTLSIADAHLTRKVSEADRFSKNRWDKHAKGILAVSLANAFLFEGTYFRDEVRNFVEHHKFHAIAIGFGPYGFELDTTLRMAKQDVAALVFKHFPECITEPQAKFFLRCKGLGLAVIHTQEGIDNLEDYVSPEEFEELSKAIEEGDSLVAISSLDEKKFIKRLMLDKCAAVRPVNESTSVVTLEGQLSKGVMMDIVAAPTLLPIFSGGLGAIPALVGNDELTKLLAFLNEGSISGLSVKVPNAELAQLQASLKALEGTTLTAGDTVQVHGAPIPKRVEPRKGGTVVKTDWIQDHFGNVHWDVHTSSEEATGQAKLRDFIKGMVVKAGSIYISSALAVSHHTLMTSNLVVLGAEGHVLAGMDAMKCMGKGSAEMRVRMAANTLRKHYGEFWNAKARELVKDETLLTERDIDGTPTVTVDYSALADKKGAYADLMKAYEAVSGRVIKVSRRVPKADWEELLQDVVNETGTEAVFEDFDTASGIAFSQAELELGKGFNGHTDKLSFTRYESDDPDLVREEDAIYVITQTTWALLTSTVVKIEYTPVSRALTTVGSMLEVASSAKGMKLHKLAAYLELGGRKRVEKLERLLLLLGLKREGGVVTAHVPGSPARTAIGDLSHWDRVIELVHGKIGDLSDATKAILAEFATKDVDDWDPKTLLVCEDEYGQVIGIDRTMLNDFGHGTEEGGALNTVRNLLGYALAGNPQGFNGMAMMLRAGFTKITDNPGVFKNNLSRGADAVGAKRVAIYATTGADHHRLFINRRGNAARRLARLFGCKVSELQGKITVDYRAPQFMFMGLEIVFDDRVGPDEFGITDRVASKCHSDFDGDQGYEIPVTDPEVAEEVMAFDTYGYANRIHEASTTEPKPWIAANRFDPSKAVWAKTQLVRLSKLHMMGRKAIEHQTIAMPLDANRAHALLCETSLPVPASWVGASNEEAQAMMMHVYEPALAGFTDQGHKAWTIFEKEYVFEGPVRYDRAAKMREFIDHVVENLDLTPSLAKVWFERCEAHRAYTKLEGRRAKLERDEQGRLVIENRVEVGDPIDVRARLALHIIAGAIKRLAQGACARTKFSRLLRDLDKMVVKSVYEADSDGGKVTLPILVKRTVTAEDGSTTEVMLPEVFNLMGLIRQAAAAGTPGCIRLVMFVDRILPALLELRDRTKSTEESWVEVDEDGNFDAPESDEESGEWEEMDA